MQGLTIHEDLGRINGLVARECKARGGRRDSERVVGRSGDGVDIGGSRAVDKVG